MLHVKHVILYTCQDQAKSNGKIVGNPLFSVLKRISRQKLVYRNIPEIQKPGQFTNMIKLNRIGNKLGAVGLFGVLLSGVMVSNQLVSEQAINSANQRAGVQQTIADHTLEGNVALRGMELALRDIRQSRNP